MNLNKFSPQSKNLGSVIRGFKSSITTQVKKLYGEWQSRFHDHVIRDAESFDRIRQYIINNPLSWKEDKFYGRKS